MNFKPLELPGVILIEPKVLGDERGFFFESYQKALFKQNGIDVNFIQANHSFSQTGVLRGLHFQVSPKAQSKCVRVVSGEAYDVVVDIQKDSKTFGEYLVTHLSGENKRMLFVPAGFAHGFYTLRDNTHFLYSVDEVYSPEHERGIIWNDPTLNIDWPLAGGAQPTVSARDQKWPTFAELYSKSL